MNKRTAQAFAHEISRALSSLGSREFQACFAHLERAHILGQHRATKHLYAHYLMFRAGLAQHDYREAFGQLPRMIAAILFSRIWVPAGNTGRARVSALKSMPIADDLRKLLS